MDNYVKGDTISIEAKLSELLPEASQNVTHMRIKNGSRLRNIIGFASNKMKEEITNDIVFSGFGPACSKAVSCAEMFKQDFKVKLYQKTKISFVRTEEYWEPQLEGLERLKVNRDVPSIHVLFSKTPLQDSDDSHFSTETKSPNKRRPRGQKFPPPPSSENSKSNKWKRPNKKKKSSAEQPFPRNTE